MKFLIVLGCLTLVYGKPFFPRLVVQPDESSVVQYGPIIPMPYQNLFERQYRSPLGVDDRFISFSHGGSYHDKNYKNYDGDINSLRSRLDRVETRLNSIEMRLAAVERAQITTTTTPAG
ncbi:UNVERIFIED_CONTAM: hypothetical protein RMT77_003908 [Armadillidium vulgare]